VAVEEKDFNEAIKMIKENCIDHQKLIAEQLSQGTRRFTEQEKDLEHLKDWQKRQNGSLGEIADCMKEIKDDVQEIKLENARGRPSWALSIAFAALLSLVTGLVVYLL